MVGTDGATISGATNLPTVNGKGLAERIRRRLRVPVGLHNDANVALLGEMRYGAARHLENAAMVTVGTGLGASVALDGKLVVGHTGLVGEIGFIPVGANGETLEDFLSGSALVARVRSQARKVKDAAEVFSLPHSPVTSAVLEEFWRSLLLAFAVLAVSYEPETIIIGGGLAPTISPSLPRLETQLGSLLPTSPRLVMTQLGDLGGGQPHGSAPAFAQQQWPDLVRDQPDQQSNSVQDRRQNRLPLFLAVESGRALSDVRHRNQCRCH